MTVLFENATVIPKCNSFITKQDVYYKMHLIFIYTVLDLSQDDFGLEYNFWVIKKQRWLNRYDNFFRKNLLHVQSLECFHLYVQSSVFSKSLSRSETAALVLLLIEDSKLSSVLELASVVR